jgi:hypothetical protein
MVGRNGIGPLVSMNAARKDPEQAMPFLGIDALRELHCEART